MRQIASPVPLSAPCRSPSDVMMMCFLPVHSWERLVYWMAAGFVLYFCYGYWNSTLAKKKAANAHG